MTKKITKRDNYNILLAIDEVASNPQLVEFINHEIELLNKKSSSSSGKLTKDQQENQAIKKVILEVMTTTPETISAVQKREERLGYDLYSNQKLASLFNQLVAEGFLVKEVIKRRSHFRKA